MKKDKKRNNVIWCDSDRTDSNSDIDNRHSKDGSKMKTVQMNKYKVRRNK